MAACTGELLGYKEFYPKMAKIAEEEGHHEIAVKLELIGKAEEMHYLRFKKALEELQANTLYKKEEKVFWICRECGCIYEGIGPPEECPLCGHPGDYFRVKFF